MPQPLSLGANAWLHLYDFMAAAEMGCTMYIIHLPTSMVFVRYHSFAKSSERVVVYLDTFEGSYLRAFWRLLDDDSD